MKYIYYPGCSLEGTAVEYNISTQAMMHAWEKGYAEGLDRKKSIFDEGIEKKWAEQWLFYANSTRYACAMMGGDYGVFENGRWWMAKNLNDILDWLKAAEQMEALQEKKE